MIGGYDRLDLLGVRFDAEMELQAKYEIAERVSGHWKSKGCTDDEFYNNCIKSIKKELKTSYSEDIEDVWKIIEEEFIN